MHLAVCRPTLSRTRDPDSCSQWELFAALLRGIQSASCLSEAASRDAGFKSEPARLTDRYTSGNVHLFAFITS